MMLGMFGRPLKEKGQRTDYFEVGRTPAPNPAIYGAAIGDICGSIYEFRNRKTDHPEEIDLINEQCFFTDDTVLTAAVADALKTKRDYSYTLVEWARRYPDASYGGGFRRWFESEHRKPYNSCGNGAAMRVSAVAWFAQEEAYNGSSWVAWGHDGPENIGEYMRAPHMDDISEIISGTYGTSAIWKKDISDPAVIVKMNFSGGTSRERGDVFNDVKLLWEAEQSAAPSHNHPEGIKGAQAVAYAIHLAWHGNNPDIICRSLEHIFDYKIARKLSDIRKDYRFETTCQGTIPAAMTALVESHDFVSAIQNAISLGGDSDTLAAITGSIAEAYYREIPEELKEFARDKLPGDIRRALGMDYYDLATGKIVVV
jgi:ADP-ribosylglycohydrolase